MITDIIIIVSLTALAAFIINIIESSRNSNKFDVIPFKESMDLINVPIVTFVNNNVKLHFLLDTGSDSSYIKKEILESLVVDNINKEAAPIITGGGEMYSYGIATFDITYNNNVFKNDFEIADIAHIWDDASNSFGITIHGILGSKFFEKYKYQIDFESLVAYSKK